MVATAMTPTANGAVVLFDQAKIDLIRRMYAKNATEDEFQVFIAICNRTQLDPTRKQIYLVKYQQSEPASIVTGIDGYRLLAKRTGKYRGQVGPWWCGPDGVWVDAWLQPGPPAAAKVGIIVDDFPEPVFAVARYESYVGRTRDGSPNRFWATMPDVQTAKCAEALALRKALPSELSGLYTEDEMEQARNPTRPAVQPPRQEVIGRPTSGASRPPAQTAAPKPIPSLSLDWNKIVGNAKERGILSRDELAQLLGVKKLSEYGGTTIDALNTIADRFAENIPADGPGLDIADPDPDTISFDDFESASATRIVDDATGEILTPAEEQRIRGEIADQYVVQKEAGRIVNVLRPYDPDFQNAPIPVLRERLEDLTNEIASKRIRQAPKQTARSAN